MTFSGVKVDAGNSDKCAAQSSSVHNSAGRFTLHLRERTLNKRKLVALTLAACAINHVSVAECELDTDQLEDLVGYEIEDVKSVAGWIDEAAGKVGYEDDWEGCRHNRTIIFSDATSVECVSYHHSSAWGPQKAVIFKNYSSKILCIDDQLIDVR